MRNKRQIICLGGTTIEIERENRKQGYLFRLYYLAYCAYLLNSDSSTIKHRIDGSITSLLLGLPAKMPWEAQPQPLSS